MSFLLLVVLVFYFSDRSVTGGSTYFWIGKLPDIQWGMLTEPTVHDAVLVPYLRLRVIELSILHLGLSLIEFLGTLTIR